MRGDERQRMCSICKEKVQDISALSLKEISREYIDSGKCVKMNSDQIQFFHSLRSVSKAAGLSAALIFFPFSPIQAQDQTPNESHCLIYGKIKSNIVSNRNIYVIIEGKTYETKTTEHGTFKLKIPKGKQIEDSNIRRITNKKIEEDYIRLKRVRIPKGFNVIGTPSF